MSVLNPSTLGLLILPPLIAWRVYSRFRRTIGRQPLSKVRPWITLTLYPTLTLLLASASFAQPQRLWGLAAGIGIGVLLGVYGLRTTTFEVTEQGSFYTPNAHLGIALSLLFIGRLAYRLFQVYVIKAAPGNANFAQSPLTLLMFGLLVGYYITYAIGLVRWGRSQARGQSDNPQATPRT